MVPKIRAFSDAYHDEEFRIHWDELRKAPDLTVGQLEASMDEWWEVMKQADQKHIPGKTWDTSWAAPEEFAPIEPRSAQKFVRIATHIRRQMNVADEHMLAHAYTHNLLEKEGELGG